MKKLNYLGIGPRIAVTALPMLAVAIFVSLRYKPAFTFIRDGNDVLFFAGIVAVAAGLILYILTVPVLLKGLRETKLQTRGTFSLCCNPLYSSIILFIVPGIALLLNSWLILTASVVGYLLFRFSISKEYAEMEQFFGDEYLKYRAETPEFVPLPLRKWLKKL